MSGLFPKKVARSTFRGVHAQSILVELLPANDPPWPEPLLYVPAPALHVIVSPEAPVDKLWL